MNNLVMLALWVLVGLLAGWLARVVVKHGGYGMREDLSSVSSGASWEAGSSGPWGPLRTRGWWRRRVSRSSGRPS